MRDIDLRRLDLNLLKVFVVLMEERSVTSAAAQLGVAQSSLSHALGRLRNKLGNPLFVRTTAGMQPTPYAVEIFEPISQALTSVQSVLNSSSGFDPASSARVFNLVMTDVCELMFMPKLLNFLRANAPGMRVVIQQLPRRTYRDVLETGAADLALGQLPLDHTDFYQQKLFDETFMCVMRAGHSLEREFTKPTFLSAEHLVIGSPAISEALIRKALGALASRRSIRLQMPHYMVAPFILAETDLIAVLPRTVSTAFMKIGGLIELPVPFPIEAVVTRQFWHERSHDDKACRWLRGVINTLFGQASPGE